MASGRVDFWLTCVCRARGALPCLLLAVASARGADVVYLSTDAASQAARKVSGRVLDFTGRELRIQPATGKERTIPAEQIERVETSYCAEQTAADAQFAQRDFRLAAAGYRAALEGDRERRPWVRRQILAQLVWCQRNLGQTELAGESFLTLLADDPQTQYFDCIPLAWSDATTTPALEERARQWLAMSDRSAAMLMGASQLLTSRSPSAAIDKLRQLARDADLRVAWLAEAQDWRSNVSRARSDELARWSAAIERSPPALRAGPYFLLGSALANREPMSAAIALMKVPILYPRERKLSAASLLAAGGCLEKALGSGHAAALYRELAGDYEGFGEVAEARRRLEAIARAPAE